MTSAQSVLTDGFTLSRSICEIMLADTPTRPAISRRLSPSSSRRSRSRVPMLAGTAGEAERGGVGHVSAAPRREER